MKTTLTTTLLTTLFLTASSIHAQTQDTLKMTVTDSLKMIGVDSIKLIEVKQPSFCRHEFSIWMAGGISALNYKPSFGDRTLNTGGALGLGYTVYFHRNWGILSGVEIALYNTTYRLPFLNDVDKGRIGFDDLTPGWTGEGEIIDYHVEISSFSEKQRQYSLNIPLMLQFQTPLPNSGHQFFAMGGAKLGIPISSLYNTSGTLFTWYLDHKTNEPFIPGYTQEGDFVYLEDLGCFFNLPYSEKKQTNDFKLSGLVSAELGVKWRLNQHLSLYTGLYMDYGFNNIQKTTDHRNRLFDFNPRNARMESKSILTSIYNRDGGTAQQFTKSVMPIAFGVKFRLAIHPCKLQERKPLCFDVHDVFMAYQKGFSDGSADCHKDTIRLTDTLRLSDTIKVSTPIPTPLERIPLNIFPKEVHHTILTDTTLVQTIRPIPTGEPVYIWKGNTLDRAPSMPPPATTDPTPPVYIWLENTLRTPAPPPVRPATPSIPSVQTITTPSHEAPNTPLEVKLQDYLEQSRISFGKDVQPYTTSHTLLQAETQRLTSEYDHLIDILTLNADYYEVNQSKLTPIMEQMLDQKIATLSRYNSNRYTITIEGHTCDLGSNNFNMDLAERRAEEVRNYMVKHGFNRQNIRVVSKGETTPIVPNIDEPHRKTNRRVVFLIQERQ